MTELYKNDGEGFYPTIITCKKDIAQALFEKNGKTKSYWLKKVKNLDESQMYHILEKTADTLIGYYYWDILADNANFIINKNDD